MTICGEHGEEIAFSSGYCPACDQIETLESDLKEEFDSEVSGLESEISNLQDQIDELEKLAR